MGAVVTPLRVFAIGALLAVVVAAAFAVQAVARSAIGWALTAIAFLVLWMHARRRTRRGDDVSWIVRTPSPAATLQLVIATLMFLAGTVGLVLAALEVFEPNPERARLVDLRPFFWLGAALSFLLMVNGVAQLVWRLRAPALPPTEGEESRRGWSGWAWFAAVLALLSAVVSATAFLSGSEEQGVLFAGHTVAMSSIAWFLSRRERG
jgi:hypothetical protein